MERHTARPWGQWYILCSAALAGLLLLPGAAQAQTPSSIAGMVADATGGVLPGVTVEASSPALIERVRTAVTDGQGLFRIIDLRPGTYTVTFTLPGFSTVIREGIVLTSDFTAQINAQLTVGNVEETVTVTGESPVVDVQTTRASQVITAEVMDTIPTARGFSSFVALTPGVRMNPSFHDVGGVQHDNAADGSIWGSNAREFKIQVDGLHAGSCCGAGGGRGRGIMLNMATVEESNVNLGGAGAEFELAGVFINLVPKEGANTFSGSLLTNYTNGTFQNDNLTDDLKAQGLTRVNTMKKIWDYNATVGGPVMQDKLWFFASARYWGRDRSTANSFFNKTQGTQFYTPDLDRPAIKYVRNRDVSARVTWQAAAKHKLNFAHTNESIAFLERVDFNLVAPEAGNYYVFFPVTLTSATWVSPVSNRLLLEAGAHYVFDPFYTALPPGSGVTFDDGSRVTSDMIHIIEATTGQEYNAPRSLGYSRRYHWDSRASASYVTGSHAFKVGYKSTTGGTERTTTRSQSLNYRVRNGQADRITQYLSPVTSGHNLRINLGIFAQDQWTIDRLTLNLGLRYDYQNAYVPPTSIVATRFLPAFDFPGVENVPNWTDLSPRVGGAFDLFGDGRTALKGSIGRYVLGSLGTTAGRNKPASLIDTSVNRTWNDVNGDFIPDCDLHSSLANGECGAYSVSSFGTLRQSTAYQNSILEGFGVRPYNWIAMVELDHTLMPNVSLHAGYIRRWFGNFTLTDNLAVGPEDYDPYSITAPLDPRLPGGGGYVISGLYNISPEKFGQRDNLVGPASDFGKWTEVHNFFNLSLQGRFPNGAMLSGGFDTGRSETDRCFVVDSPEEMRHCNRVASFASNTQIKMVGTYPLPWDMGLSANWQNISTVLTTGTGTNKVTDWQWARYSAPNSIIAPSLGRNLSSGAFGSARIELVDPHTDIPDRLNQIDVRLTKNVRLAEGQRLELQLDVFNALNASTIVTINTTYGGSWLEPLQVMDGRFLKFGARYSF